MRDNYYGTLPQRRVVNREEGYGGRFTDTLECGHVLPGCKGAAETRRCWMCEPIEALREKAGDFSRVVNDGASLARNGGSSVIKT